MWCQSDNLQWWVCRTFLTTLDLISNEENHVETENMTHKYETLNDCDKLHWWTQKN